MANELQRFSIATRGLNFKAANVVEDSVNNGATTTACMELNFLRSTSLTRKEVIQGLEQIRRAVMETDWPPNTI